MLPDLLLPEIQQIAVIGRVVGAQHGLADHAADQAHRRIHDDAGMVRVGAGAGRERGPDRIETGVEFLDRRDQVSTEVRVVTRFRQIFHRHVEQPVVHHPPGVVDDLVAGAAARHEVFGEAVQVARSLAQHVGDGGAEDRLAAGKMMGQRTAGDTGKPGDFRRRGSGQSMVVQQIDRRVHQPRGCLRAALLLRSPLAGAAHADPSSPDDRGTMLGHLQTVKFVLWRPVGSGAVASPRLCRVR